MLSWTRRGFFMCTAAVAVSGSWSGPASAAPRADTTLNQIAAAFSSAAGALAGVASRLNGLSAGSLDRQSALRLQTRLTALLSALDSVYSQQTDLIAALSAYYQLWGPEDWEGARRYRSLSRQDRLERRRRHWINVAGMTSLMLTNVSRMLRTLRSQRSDLVNGGAYASLEAALGQRQSLLRNIGRMPPPATAPDFAALNNAIDRYEQLHAALQQTVEATGSYIERLA